MNPRTILVAVADDGVARLTLNRPHVRNALDRAMVNDLHGALADLETRADVRALVIDAAGGKAFMSGADISELRERRRADALQGINATLFARVEAFLLRRALEAERGCRAATARRLGLTREGLYKKLKRLGVG